MTLKRTAIAALILLLVLIAVVAYWWQPFLVHASQESGTSESASRAYNWWSGAGTVVLQALDPTIIAALLLFYWHKTCHNRTCLRLAHHTTAKGHRLCKVCIGKPEADLDLHTIHPDHQ